MFFVVCVALKSDLYKNKFFHKTDIFNNLLISKYIFPHFRVCRGGQHNDYLFCLSDNIQARTYPCKRASIFFPVSPVIVVVPGFWLAHVIPLSDSIDGRIDHQNGEKHTGDHRNHQVGNILL